MFTTIDVLVGSRRKSFFVITERPHGRRALAPVEMAASGSVTAGAHFPDRIKSLVSSVSAKPAVDCGGGRLRSSG